MQERAGEGRGGTGKGRGRDGEGSGRGVMARVGEGVRTMSWLILERNDLRRFQDILRNKIKKKKVRVCSHVERRHLSYTRFTSA